MYQQKLVAWQMKYGRIIWVTLSVILCMVMGTPVYASASDGKAVVFLLDASGSMQANDPHRYAIDGIAQLVYTLPTNYEIGFVAYNTDVCASQPLLDNSQRNQIMAAARSVRYEDYSNAGAGLAEAVEMLASGSASSKSIVVLSDGEFLMADDTRTAQSFSMYQEAIEQALQDEITIHVIGLGKDMENTENSIFQAAARTGGGVYYVPQALEIQSAIDSILDDQLCVKQITAALVDADGDTESLMIDLPFAHASTIRVLLTSKSPIQNLKTNFKSDKASQINGERYSLIEMEKPQSDKMDISFVGTAGNQVRITLIPEYQVTTKAEVSYEDRIPEDEDATQYDREAEIVYTFHDWENESIQLWTEDYFNHSKISLQSGGVTTESALEQGRIVVREPVAGDSVKEIAFDCFKLPVNVLTIDAAEVILEAPPTLPIEEPVVEPDPPYALYVVIVLAAAGIIVALLFKQPKTQPEPAPVSDGRPAPGKSSYVGKLNIYVTRTPSGYDIRPLVYDLFRLPSTRVISMAEILENCGVKEVFEGADRIFLSSGQGHSIVLTNQSDCCLMKSGEILMKQKSYQIFAESKIDITFEDEVSELTFQYKDLKPSEMR